MATSSRPKLHVKRGATPDERRPFKAHGYADVQELGGAGGLVMRGVFEPGWRWSSDVGPIVGTSSCQAPHLNYVVSGRLHIRMDDGQETEVGPGDFVRVEPGHDAWVVGDEPCVLVDFGGYDYARAASTSSLPDRPRSTERARS